MEEFKTFLAQGKRIQASVALHIAAEAGDGYAMWILGKAHRDGYLVKNNNINDAVRWFQKSYNAGFKRAIRDASNVSVFDYMENDDKYNEAFKCIDRGYIQEAIKHFMHDSTDMFCQMEIARLLEKHGGGAPIEWYEKAALQGFPPAMTSLGLHLMNKHKTNAWRWFNKAAKLGHDAAFFLMHEPIFSNMEEDESTRKALLSVLCTRKYKKSLLNVIQMDIVLIIARCMWETRKDIAWSRVYLKK